MLHLLHRNKKKKINIDQPADLGSSSLFWIWQMRLWIRLYTLSHVLTGFSTAFIEFTIEGLPVGAS